MGDFFRESAASGSLLVALPVALLAGLVSFFSPCVIPLLPGYLSYATGLSGADLESAGRNDHWAVVPIEKVDLDPEFLHEHPEGADAIDWIVTGPSTDDDYFEDLGLTMARETLESAEPVQTFGDWTIHRVQRP